MENAFILVVEDDVDIRETLSEYLEELGYRVKSASHGAEALATLQRDGPPCLILLDLMMPVMDGYQFRAAQLANRALAEVPVVVLSAGSNVRAGELRSVAVLQKPMDLDQLTALVAQHC